MPKTKRVWTDQQKEAARQRMAVARAARRTSTAILDIPDGDVEARVRERDPEVQAVIDSMTPERRAKLAQIQSQTLQRTIQVESNVGSHMTEQALARHETDKLPPVMARPGSRELSIIVRNDGTMVSQYGPCICGAMKRQWHTICLREPTSGVGDGMKNT